MKFCKVLLLALTILSLSIPFKAIAASQATDQDQTARIERLERELEGFQSDQAARAAKAKPSTFDVYGFVSAQVFWGSAKTWYSTGINTTAGMSSVRNKAANVGNGNAWIGFTPQNSRVGFNWNGPNLSQNTTIGAKLEMDFLNVLRNTAYGTSPLPRVRHLYLEVLDKKWSFLAGQTWDIFSPMNTRSLNFAGNIWFQGNLGVRRPQLKFSYFTPFADVNQIKVSVSADYPANTDDLYNAGVESGIPYGEGLVQYSRKMKNGDLIIAASTTVGAQRSAGKYRKTYGVAGSIAVPLHKFFKPEGEIQYGQNLGNFLSYSGTTGDARNIAAWGEVTSSWCKYFETNIGYGIDNIQSSKIAAAATAPDTTTGITRNQMFFANMRIIPVSQFYIGLEYEYLKTAYKGNGSYSSNVAFTNIVYSF